MPGLAAWSSASSRVVSAMSWSTWAFLASASSRAACSRASAASALALRSLISASTASSLAWELTLVAFCWVSLSIAEFWLRMAWSARSMVSVRLPPLLEPKNGEKVEGTPPDLWAWVAICPISFLVSAIFFLSVSSCWAILAFFCWARSLRVGEGLGLFAALATRPWASSRACCAPRELALVQDEVSRRPARSWSPRIRGNAGPGPLPLAECGLLVLEGYRRTPPGSGHQGWPPE